MQCLLSRFLLSIFGNLRVRTNGYHYTPLHFRTSLPIVVHVAEVVKKVSMARRTHCRSLVSINFRGGSSSFSFFSSFCCLISLGCSSKSPLQSCCPWIYNNCSSFSSSYGPSAYAPNALQPKAYCTAPIFHSAQPQ